jgi:hypothetical protein
MKSKNTIDESKVREFWDWFASRADDIRDSGENTEVLSMLDMRIRGIDERLSWEIGPGRHEPMLLAISPNLDPDMLPVTKMFVELAPTLDGWEFYSCRQAKQWNYSIELEIDGRMITLDASKWYFVLLRYPDGAHEVLLEGEEFSQMTEDKRWEAAAVALESALGEQIMLERVNDFSGTSSLDPQYACKKRHIQHLRAAIVP